MKAILHTDGGARGNPGPAGIGFVLKMRGKDQIEHSEYIGESTNNQAEYRALISGLERAKKEGIDDLTIFMDSQLIVQQVRGNYKVKNAGLKPLHERVQRLARKFDNVSFSHIPRSKNKQADKLVNNAIDKALRQTHSRPARS